MKSLSRHVLIRFLGDGHSTYFLLNGSWRNSLDHLAQPVCVSEGNRRGGSRTALKGAANALRGAANALRGTATAIPVQKRILWPKKK